MDMEDATTSDVASPSVPTTPAVAAEEDKLEVSDEIENLAVAFVKKNQRADLPAQKMAELKAQREKLKAERKVVQRSLENEVRKRAKLKAKAKQLSAVELVHVLSLRAQQAATKEKQLPEAIRKSSSSKKGE